MYLPHEIIKEGDPRLRLKAKEIKLPISKENIEIAKNLNEYLIASMDEELVKKLNLNPGVGIAAPQVGKSIKMFAVNIPLEDKYLNLIFVNPKITYKSTEQIYLPNGEGCLSVTRDTKNLLTPRSETIKIKADILDLKTGKTTKKELKFNGYPAIVIQHEYDHLDGVLYVDKLYQEDEINAKPLF